LTSEITQAPSPALTETWTPTAELTPTPLPTLTRTPVPTYVVVRLTEVGNFLTIGQVFKEYGKPEEVWFSSTGKVPETWPTYVEIVLFYPADNILFLFWEKQHN
jgi:hypothetical protein